MSTYGEVEDLFGYAFRIVPLFNCLQLEVMGLTVRFVSRGKLTLSNRTPTPREQTR